MHASFRGAVRVMLRVCGSPKVVRMQSHSLVHLQTAPTRTFERPEATCMLTYSEVLPLCVRTSRGFVRVELSFA